MREMEAPKQMVEPRVSDGKRRVGRLGNPVQHPFVSGPVAGADTTLACVGSNPTLRTRPDNRP